MKKILALTALTGALTFGTVTFTETKPAQTETDQAQAAVCNTELYTTNNKSTVKSINRCGYAKSAIKRTNGLTYMDPTPDYKNWSSVWNRHKQYSSHWAKFW